MSTSTHRNSFTKPELSPSSLSAAAAEVNTIRRLKREVLGLTLAASSLKKNSKEREFLTSKLEVAREELDAVLEDEQLFRSISSAGSDTVSYTARSMPEEQRDEILHMIPTPPLNVIPTPHPVKASIEELEEKLRQQVKYSLEWFEIKKQIDAKTKKLENAIANANNMTYFRSSSTGSIITPTRRETKSETPRPALMKSIKESQNIQCLKDLLHDVPKYSLQWFELKRIIHRRCNKDPKLKSVQRRKINSAEQMKENSPNDVVSQDENQAAYYQSQINSFEPHGSLDSSYSNSANEVVKDYEEELDSLSSASSGSKPNSQTEPQDVADTVLPRTIDHTPSISDASDADIVVANHNVEQDQNVEAIQHIERLQNFLERVPKYSRLVVNAPFVQFPFYCLFWFISSHILISSSSLITPMQILRREYYQTRKIIRLLQDANSDAPLG